MMKMRSVSVIIPNYNGKELLKENLPVLIEHTFNRPANREIIVIDDGSTDGSAAFLKDNFPQVKVISLGGNFGFAYACNAGVREAGGEIVYLLNSDVRVTAGFLEPIIECFNNNDDVFAVCSWEAPWDSQNHTPAERKGISLVKFKYGIFWYWYEDFPVSRNPLSISRFESFSVSGGHTAYEREKFLSLGGFDTLFRPFYGEDGDICWRAWKNGWRSLYQTQSLVYHKCQSTIGRYNKPRQIQAIHWKNRFLLVWKNLTSGWFILKHLFFIIPELGIMPFVGKKEFVFGFFSALLQLPELVKSRKRSRIKDEVYTDKELFRRFSHLPHLPVFKILYLHETTKISGAENSLLSLVKGLNPKLFKAYFILPEDGPLAEELKNAGFAVDFVKLHRIRRIFGVSRAIKKIREIIKTNGVDLIHSNSIRTHIYAAMAGRLEKIPVVWHERNLITREIIDPDRWLSFLPDRIICNSQAIAKRFLKKGKLPNRVEVVYNGVDTQVFSPKVSGQKIREEFGISLEELVIGMASRLGPDKGQETFLKAAERIIAGLKPGMKIRFLVVGDAVFEQDKWREKYLKDMAQTLGLAGKVIFSGFRNDMPSVYAAMDIFVLASDSEPCGRVIIEAMAIGRPVVATNSGGTPEIVEDGISGCLFEPKNHYDLTEAISLLINNSTLTQDISLAARKRIEENFSLEKNVSRIQGIYLKLFRANTQDIS